LDCIFDLLFYQGILLLIWLGNLLGGFLWLGNSLANCSLRLIILSLFGLSGGGILRRSNMIFSWLL